MSICARHCNYAYTGCFHCLVEEQEQRIAELEALLGKWVSHDGHVCPSCGMPDSMMLDMRKRNAELEAELNQCLDCCKRVGELEAENERLKVELGNCKAAQSDQSVGDATQ